MNLKSLVKKLFFGYEVLERIGSPLNGEITVVEDLFSRREMRVGGVTQSGGLVEKLWKVALSIVHSSNFKVQSCLILGLGCGNAAKSISKRWPKAKITGVEIDLEVVKIGKKYFGLDKIPNLEIVVGDALEKIKYKKSKIKNKYKKLKNENEGKFDLVLIDLYLGKGIPKGAESEVFINGVKKILNNDGIAIFNCLSYGEFKKEAVEFSEKLSDYFPKVWTKRAITNLLIFCSQ